jgi:hypothetical protein
VPAASEVEFRRVKEYVPFAFAVNATFGESTAAALVTVTNSVPPNPVAGVAVRVTVAELPASLLIVAEAGLKVSAAATGVGGVTGLPPPPPPQPAIAARIKQEKTCATRAAALPEIRFTGDPILVFL